MENAVVVFLPRSFATMIIFLDAVGTLIYPHPSAMEVYHRAGVAFGSSLTRETIAHRFKELFELHFAGDRLMNPTSESRQIENWKTLVRELFADLSAVDSIFEHLWNHFARASSWRLYPDVESALAAISRRGIRFGIASNFDRRLPAICGQIPLLHSTNWVFTSAEIGWSKPNRLFFDAIQNRVNANKNDLVMVGDNEQVDYQGALSAGWQAFHLARANVHLPSQTALAAAPGRIPSLTNLIPKLITPEH